MPFQKKPRRSCVHYPEVLIDSRAYPRCLKKMPKMIFSQWFPLLTIEEIKRSDDEVPFLKLFDVRLTSMGSMLVPHVICLIKRVPHYRTHLCRKF
ncbi:hypothetical protein U9M48_019286 [Paspalum notatum var. saurae]|uniref:Uncharacterized protein n=1 Tax=Paspalum notatum var. saurae TaxID=547442 RepID=A0AAQ3TC26_PASNO